MAESQNPSEIERNWRKMFRLAASMGIYDYFFTNVYQIYLHMIESFKVKN